MGMLRFETPTGSVDAVKKLGTATLPHFAKSPRTSRIAVGTVLLASGLILAGCTQQMLGDNGDESAEQSDRPLAGEASTPDPSPQARKDLPGAQGEAAPGIKDVVSVERSGNQDRIAVLREGSLSIGSPDDVLRADAKIVEVDKSCHNLSTSAKGVAVACQDALLEFGPDAKELKNVHVEGLVSSGTFADTGKAVAGAEGSDKIQYFDAEGNNTGSEVVTANSDETLLINAGSGEPQRAAVIDRSQTSISDIDIDNAANNAALRIGQGVGEAADGRGDDGVIVASDHRQQQVQIFSMLDVVRLHQEAPVGPSPWAVRWDFDRQIAWVSTTGDNQLTGYRINSGTPLPVAQFDTIADVRSIIDSPDGELLLISEDGEWQKLETGDIDQGLERGVDTTEEFGTRPIAEK